MLRAMYVDTVWKDEESSVSNLKIWLALYAFFFLQVIWIFGLEVSLKINWMELKLAQHSDVFWQSSSDVSVMETGQQVPRSPSRTIFMTVNEVQQKPVHPRAIVYNREFLYAFNVNFQSAVFILLYSACDLLQHLSLLPLHHISFFHPAFPLSSCVNWNTCLHHLLSTIMVRFSPNV